MNNHGTILLAEDDENDILLFRRAFAKASVPNPVIVVKDGEGAIEYLSGAGVYSDRNRYPFPSLLITDLKMPRLTGFDVLAWLRNQAKPLDLKTIVLTSSVDEADKRRAFDLGARAYLVKPVGHDGLVELALQIKDRWLAAAQRGEL
jgi:CheY-like chemotaxis protein